MNPDPSRIDPGDDLTTEGRPPEVVDTMAMEALTAAEEPRPEVDEAIVHDESDPMVGRRLGPYRLMARIGGGGMGTVYLAERAEGFAHRVAVKLIRRGLDSEAIVRRFRTEIQVQAALGKHPNIAGLVDAGTAEDGRPYFVMEYVDGRRIDEYADEHRLGVAGRVRLFAQVCDAVQFAHQHAVIHRDLKPGNILVTADGVPKLIDFGIAKLVAPGAGGIGGADDIDGPTRTGELVLTPEFASPEQVLGEPLTTTSDVYALGVVLYRLLTGRSPYRLKTRALAEVFQAICEQSPERPSTAVVPRRRPDRSAPTTAGETTSAPETDGPAPPPAAAAPSPPGPDPEELAAARGTTPAGLRRALAGDLDTIVLMAMRKEPERRYASAGQLAEDLRAYLDGRPVRARGDSTLYRARKFVRRNAAAVAAAAMLLLALVGGVVGTAWGLVLARRERDRAEASSREARRAVDRFFTRVSEERLLNQPGMLPLRKELLGDARGFYERFLSERAGDPALRAELAAAQGRVGKIAMEIGSPAEADDQLRRAIARWEEVLRSRPEDREAREQLARVLNDRAVVLLRIEGRRDEALASGRRAVEVLESLVDERPTAPIRRALGLALVDVAQIQHKQGHPGEAIETLRRAVAMVEPMAAEDPGSIEPKIALARANALLAQLLMEQPDALEPALAASEQAVARMEEVVAAHPELANQTYSLAMNVGDLGIVQQMAGQLDSALGSGRRSVELLERLDRQYPGSLNYRGALAGACNALSDLHRRRGEPAESLALAERARDLLEKLVAEHPEDTYSRIDLSKSYNNIGRIHQQAGDPADALKSFRRAVDLLENLPKLDARNSYNLACNLSLCVPLFGARPGTQGVEVEEALNEGDKLRRKLYGNRAIEVLRRAVRGGFLNTDILLSDPDLAAIRDRDDFRQIVRDLAKTSADEGKGG